MAKQLSDAEIKERKERHRLHEWNKRRRLGIPIVVRFNTEEERAAARKSYSRKSYLKHKKKWRRQAKARHRADPEKRRLYERRRKKTDTRVRAYYAKYMFDFVRSDKGKEYFKKYRATKKAKRTAKKWYQSSRGKECVARQNFKRRLPKFLHGWRKLLRASDFERMKPMLIEWWSSKNFIKEMGPR